MLVDASGGIGLMTVCLIRKHHFERWIVPASISKNNKGELRLKFSFFMQLACSQTKLDSFGCEKHDKRTNSTDNQSNQQCAM